MTRINNPRWRREGDASELVRGCCVCCCCIDFLLVVVVVLANNEAASFLFLAKSPVWPQGDVRNGGKESQPPYS